MSKIKPPQADSFAELTLPSKSKAERQNVSEDVQVEAQFGVWQYEFFRWCDSAHGVGAEGFMSDLKVPTYKLGGGVCLSGECWLSASR